MQTGSFQTLIGWTSGKITDVPLWSQWESHKNPFAFMSFHRGTKVVFPDFKPMRVPEEPVCIHLFRQNSVFTSLHLRSTVYFVPPLESLVEGHNLFLNQIC
jgi:hypothetical protein